MPRGFPASTPFLCVLPFTSNGTGCRFAISSSALPPQLQQRLSEDEFRDIVASINAILAVFINVGFFSLLCPFVFLDVITMTIIAFIDPWLLISPWDYSLHDFMLPLALEFLLFVCAFPVLVYMMHRRLTTMQSELTAKMEELTAKYACRGLHFELKQRLVGASSTFWAQIQLMPIIKYAVPCPYMVPYPIYMQYPEAPAVGTAAEQTERTCLLQENQRLRQQLQLYQQQQWQYEMMRQQMHHQQSTCKDQQPQQSQQ